MNDLPCLEAQAILLRSFVCPDVPPWTFNKLNPNQTILECGLVETDGARAGLQIQLIVARSAKTRFVNFKFTVFRVSIRQKQRVYQLDVNAAARAPKNWHDLVHEHVGDKRICGPQAWLSWDFKEALDYFCRRTNIAFVPPLIDPEHFELMP